MRCTRPARSGRFRTRGPNRFRLSLLVSAHADAVKDVIDANIAIVTDRSVWRMSKPMISLAVRTPVRRTARVASDCFLADAYGSNINAAPAISVGARAPRKRYSGEIPASPKRDARID